MTGENVRNKIIEYLQKDESLNDIIFDYANNLNDYAKYKLNVTDGNKLYEYTLSIQTAQNEPEESANEKLSRICDSIILHNDIYFKKKDVIYKENDNGTFYYIYKFKITIANEEDRRKAQAELS